MSDNATPQEAWNMATETLKRLSKNLDYITYCFIKRDLVEVRNGILSLRRNIMIFIEPSDLNKIDEELKKLPSDWQIGNIVNPKHYSLVYEILDNVYIICLRYMKEKGVMMPKKIDLNKAVSEM